MGSLQGHLLPGSIWIILSVWWFIGEILQKGQRNDTARTKIPRRKHPHCKSVQPTWYLCPGPVWLSKLPVEPVIKIAFAVLGIIAEIFESKVATLFDENGEFVPEHMDNYAHSVMYAFFGLTGVVDLVAWYNILPLPPKFDYFVFSLAFWVEGLLFFFHLHGRDELNVRLHTILYVIIFVTAAAFLLAVVFDQFIPFIGFLRPYLLALQGTWFFQAGFVLFGSNPWKNIPSNVEFLGIAFAFHALVLFLIHLTCHIICYHCFIKKKELKGEFLENSLGLEPDVMPMLLD